MKKARLVAGLVALLVGSMVPARAADVTVAVDNPGGSRTLFVEDLLGAPLTTLSFGATRSQPFRVRVVDATMDRTGFTVSATMTNLYRDTGTGLDFGVSIPSADLAFGSPTDPLNLLGVSALVQPLFDTVSTIADPAICLVLDLSQVLGSCTVSLSDLQGVLQTLPLPVDLDTLAGLPLVPQAAEAGAFTNPEYAGVAASAPQPPSPPAPTSRRVIAGTPVSVDALLATLQGVLDGVLAATPLAGQVDTGTLTAALRTALGPAFDLLSTAQVGAVVASTVATVQALLPDQVLAQSGTYLSFPVLTVTVPGQAAAGSYKGTLVVTGLQP